MKVKFTRRRSSVLVRLFASIGPVVCGAPAALAQNLTADDAAARAETFMREIGRLSPMPAGTDADRAQAWPRRAFREVYDRLEGKWLQYPRNLSWIVERHELSGLPGTGNAWRVKTRNEEIHVSVDADTGVVRSIHDNALRGIIGFDPALPEIQCISYPTVLTRATNYLRAGGVHLDSFVLNSVEFSDTGVPAKASSRRWVISWQRIWQGIPFMNQRIWVELDAAYGRLLWYGLAMSVPLPAISRLDVSSSAACTIARQYVARVGAVAGDSPVSLKIVLPTDFWLNTPNRVTQRDFASRLAWIVRTPVKPAEGYRKWADAWVDAATGNVIGGDVFSSRGSGLPALPGARILAALGLSQQLELRPKTSDSGPTMVALARTNPLRYFGAVSAAGPPLRNESLPKFAATHRLTATLKSGKQEAFDFDAIAGLIRDSEGGIVKAGSLLSKLLRPLAERRHTSEPRRTSNQSPKRSPPR